MTSSTRRINQQIGAIFPRQSMKDASGVSQIVPATRCDACIAYSMLDAAHNPLEAVLSYTPCCVGKAMTERDHRSRGRRKIDLAQRPPLAAEAAP